MKRSFPPVVDADTRVLVLGSLPGEESLARAQYYGHPRNLFWRLMGAVVGAELVSLAYKQRLAALLAAGVGLWDVVEAAEREGSLDAAIRDASANDLRALVATLPALRAVSFNGATSAKIGMPQLAGTRLELIRLPSSSPAYAFRTFEQKLEDWMRLRPHLEGNRSS